MMQGTPSASVGWVGKYHVPLTLALALGLLACSRSQACKELLSSECVDRSPTFGVVRVGSFAHDRGCQYRSLVYDCRVDDPTTPARAMAAAGWAKGDRDAKVRLALAWIAEIGGARVLAAEVPAFARAGKSFAPPSSEPLPDGGVRLLYWVARPASMTPEVRYVQVETAFDGRGVIVSQRELDRFEVDLQDLR